MSPLCVWSSPWIPVSSAICLAALTDTRCPECREPIKAQKPNQELIRWIRAQKQRAVTKEQKGEVKRESAMTGDAPLCELCSENKATIHCKDCVTSKNFCDECNVFAHRAPAKKGHQTTSWKVSFLRVMCLDHHQECTLYCTCNKTICHLCIHGKHKGKGHSTTPVLDQAASSKRKILAKVTELEKYITPFQALANAVDETHKRLIGTSMMSNLSVDKETEQKAESRLGTADATIAAIHLQFAHARTLLVQRETELMTEIQTKKTLCVSSLEEQMDEVTMVLAKIHSVSFHIKQKLDQNGIHWMLEHEKQLIDEVDNELKSQDPIHKAPRVSSDMQVQFDTSQIQKSINAIGRILKPSTPSIVQGFKAKELKFTDLKVNETYDVKDREGELPRSILVISSCFAQENGILL